MSANISIRDLLCKAPAHSRNSSLAICLSLQYVGVVPANSLGPITEWPNVFINIEEIYCIEM